MNSYCLIFKIKPSLESNDPHAVAVAYSAVYVFCDTEKEAETRAIAHLNQRDWKILATETVSEMTPELLALLDETQATVYQEAMTNGISFVILDAWPQFLGHLFSDLGENNSSQT